MRHGGFLRQACLTAALLFGIVSTASGHTIEIKFDNAATASANGTINFNFFDEGDGIIAISKFALPVISGWTGSNMASFMATTLNANPAFAFGYTATVGTETVPGFLAPTYATVTITPTPGVGSDLDFGSMYVSPKTDPGITGGGIKVKSTAPATTTLQLVENNECNNGPVGNGPCGSNLSIDWALGVVDQNGNLVGAVYLPGVPDTTGPSALISMLETGLLNQSIPAVANGSSLSLTTANNDFFVLSRSAAGSLDFNISDGQTPEPNALLLFGSGFLGSAIAVWRKAKRAGKSMAHD
jgi:hypothetical protein